LYFFSFFSFHLGRSSITMRPLLKKKNLCIFTIGQVAWNNETTCEFPRILSSGRSPGTMRLLASFFAFYHQAGRLEQWDHLWNPSRCFFLSGWLPGTIRPLVKPFSRFILHRAGHLEKWDHSRNPSRCFFLSGWSPGTIRPLVKPFSHFILHRAGHLEKWDHSWNPSRCFFLSGWSPGKIRPLAKPFSRFILHQAGRLEQLDHLKKNQKKSIKK